MLPSTDGAYCGAWSSRRARTSPEPQEEERGRAQHEFGESGHARNGSEFTPENFAFFAKSYLPGFNGSRKPHPARFDFSGVALFGFPRRSVRA
jgi:hypothetical protein